MAGGEKIGENNGGKPAVLFICRRNAGRSQMAEGLMRAHFGEVCSVYSAGLQPSKLSGNAIRVMQEIGIDISSQQSKDISQLPCNNFAAVVILDGRLGVPSSISTGKIISMDIPDPASLKGTEEDIIAGFRSVRDQINESLLSSFKEFPFY
jgi:arsenate reductase